MQRRVTIGCFLGAAVLSLAAAAIPSHADVAGKKKAEPQGVKLLTTVHPDHGFVDDAYAFDGAGGRLALVRADAGQYAELEILDLAQGGKTLAKVDLAPATTSAVSVRFIGDGSKLFVVGREPGAEKATGYLLDLTGKIVRKVGPGTDVAYVDVAGAPAATVFDARVQKGGGTTYDVTVTALETGKSIAHRSLAADATGLIKSLDLSVLFWRDGYTQLVGRKAGKYDKFKDQRMNDGEGIYDLVDGQVLKDTLINDVLPYTRRTKLRQAHPNQGGFLYVTEDHRKLAWLGADDKEADLELDEPFVHYDFASLLAETGRDGKVYFTLTIDPVNPDAVARKVADPEYIDLYTWEPAAGGKATRLARLPKGDKPFSWHASSGRWAVLRKHKGFDRGGADLEIYDLAPLAPAPAGPAK